MMKIFILWLLFFSYYSEGAIPIPGVERIKKSIKETIDKYRSEWTQEKRQQLQKEICNKKNIDTLLNEASCKGDQACLDQLPQIKEQIISECAIHLENPQKKAPATPDQPSIENTQQSTQQNINKDNSSPDIQKKGNNTIIKLQPIKL